MYSKFGGPPLTRIVTSQKNEGLYVVGCHRKLINAIADPKYLVSIVGSVVGLILLLVIGMGQSGQGRGWNWMGGQWAISHRLKVVGLSHLKFSI